MGSFRVLFVKDGSVLKNIWSREKERYRETCWGALNILRLLH